MSIPSSYIKVLIRLACLRQSGRIDNFHVRCHHSQLRGQARVWWVQQLVFCERTLLIPSCLNMVNSRRKQARLRTQAQQPTGPSDTSISTTTSTPKRRWSRQQWRRTGGRDDPKGLRSPSPTSATAKAIPFYIYVGMSM